MKSVYFFLFLSVIYGVDSRFAGKSGTRQLWPLKKGQWAYMAKRKVSIIADSISYKDLFIAVRKQTGMQAFFGTTVLDPAVKVKADFNHLPLDSVLRQLLSKRGLEWFYYDDGTFVITGRETTTSFGKSEITPVHDSMGVLSKLKKGEADLEKIWLHPPKVAEVISYEQKIGSGFYFSDIGVYGDAFPIPLTRRYHPSLVPLIAERWEAEGHLPIYVRYYYTPEDSVVRTVFYSWQRLYESKFSEDQQDLIEKEAALIRAEEHKKPDFYKSEYERIKKQIIHKFGPASTVASNTLAWDKRRFYAELSFVFNPKAHFIRFKHCWKKPEITR